MHRALKECRDCPPATENTASEDPQVRRVLPVKQVREDGQGQADSLAGPDSRDPPARLDRSVKQVFQVTPDILASLATQVSFV